MTECDWKYQVHFNGDIKGSMRTEQCAVNVNGHCLPLILGRI